MSIDPDLVDIALSRISGTQFEKFANAFFPALLGVEYSPLGGLHDGGADAFGGDIVNERRGRAGHFYQSSVQADTRAKIKATVERLREFGREPKLMTYFTSRVVPAIDVLEDKLGEDLDVVIRIRDGAYIRSHINDHASTVSAYDKYLAPETDFLRSVGSAKVIGDSKHVTSPAVYVFLRQEIDKLDGDISLINSVTDSLAIWALEGTDPDAEIFMSAEDVLDRINEHVPSARTLIEGRIEARLHALSKKSYPGGRQVNWHRDRDRYVLPLRTRERIADENKEDEALRLRVLRRFEDRAREMPDQLVSDEAGTIAAETTLRAFQLAFEEEGLEFAHFVSTESDSEYVKIGDAVRRAIEDRGVSGEGSIQLARTCLTIARECLYRGSDDERKYLGRLARTYTLLFTLRNEPRLVSYFEKMAADFYLYVGSDILVRALSERYLDPKDQLVRNVLLMASAGGATLVLTQPVLEEVVWNLRSSDLEFRNHIEGVEHRLDADLIREVPKILVRAYLYNRVGVDGPATWPGFVEQFCNHSSLFRPEAEDQIRRYLQATFSMEYRTREALENLSDPGQVAELTSNLLETKDKEELAMNDALLACSVYGHRKAQRETSQANQFGFRTWWLTNETRILRHSRFLEDEHHGARYMMRPDFLLNFLTFAPKATEVRRTFANVFPSVLGVQLSRRMDEGTFHRIMKEVKRAETLEEGRRLAVMAECADRLKSDFARRYHVELTE
ncbi:hypothetical protein ACFVDI_14325 [Nocardioides sp. NPDC057767]|uniref:hypothetical protein n=1 Tax=unclassified Nocardioides TaxID=2615069 RepID=UPI00366DBAC1